MATLTKDMVNDLHKGVATISLLEASAATMALNALDFSDADQLFTLKDSFSINQADPTVTEIKIDQDDATIDTDIEMGEFNITGNIPSVAQAVLAYFYNAAGNAITATGASGTEYSGADYFNTPKDVKCTVMIESASKNTAIVFANMKFTAVMVQDDMAQPLYLKFTGTVLTNTVSGKGDFAILKANAAAA